MTEITGTITVNTLSQDNGHFVCQMSSALSDRPVQEVSYSGQSKEHAIAIALEHLAGKYRQIAEELQNIDHLEVEHSESGEPIIKHYHVVLHYEDIREAESIFEALQDTVMGNTVVENAKINFIQIDPDLPVESFSKYDEP